MRSLPFFAKDDVSVLVLYRLTWVAVFSGECFLILYRRFMFCWPAAFSASTVNSSMYVLFSSLALRFICRFVFQYCACILCFSAWSCVLLIWSFRCPLLVISVRVSVKSHFSCFLVFLLKTVLQSANQVFRRLCQCPSTKFSGSWKSTLNLFLSSILSICASNSTFKLCRCTCAMILPLGICRPSTWFWVLPQPGGDLMLRLRPVSLWHHAVFVFTSDFWWCGRSGSQSCRQRKFTWFYGLTRSLKVQNSTKSSPFSFCTPMPCLPIMCLLFVLSALGFVFPMKIFTPLLGVLFIASWIFW